jgi:nitroimidazol reductase NimA-like FMN-containing flavoprotein (pyridoxamine 5'-phosphate oxidase superfamily)
VPSRRSSIELTEDEQQAFLASAPTLQIASNGRDGYPHLVAMWFAVIDGLIHFTTFGKSQKVLNLRRDPKITVMIEGGTQYSELKGLVIKGTAELVEDVGVSARVMAAVGAKQSGRPAPEALSEGALRVASKRVTVRIHPVDVYSWDHAKLGGRY